MEELIKIDEIQIESHKASKVENRDNFNVYSVVERYSSEEFERFILDYLLFVKKDELEIEHIYRIGGTGDKGIDIYLKTLHSQLYYYQCKHYNKPLTEGIIKKIILKILYYSFKEEIKVPNKIFIVALKDSSLKSAQLLSNPEELKVEVLKDYITSLEQEKINIHDKDKDDLQKYLESWDFSNVAQLSLKEIINEFYDSKYGSLRFDNNIEIPRLNYPKEENKKTLEFVTQIELFKSPNPEFKKMIIDDAKTSYFTALSLKYTSYYFFKDDKEFEELVTEINESLKYDLFKGVSSLDDVSTILQNATRINTSKSYLDRILHMVGNSDRKGICHYLVQNKRGRWI